MSGLTAEYRHAWCSGAGIREGIVPVISAAMGARSRGCSAAALILAELPADFVVRDFDISAAASEVVFDRVLVNSDIALIGREH